MADISKLLKGIEYLFISAIIFSLGYVAYFFMVKSTTTDFPVMSSTNSKIEQPVQEFSSPVSKPYDSYSTQIEARDIFTMPSTTPVKSETPSGQLPSGFKVVGIVKGDPDQVIVEDSNAHQTYFIDRGHPQVGISIDHIDQDKVFLNYQGQAIQVDLQGQDINVTKPSEQNT